MSNFVIVESEPKWPFNGEFNEVKDEVWFRLKDVKTGRIGMGVYLNREAAEKAANNGN